MNISFKAQYISSPTIQKKKLFGNNFKNKQVNFVQLMAEDVDAVKTAAKKWKDKMASNIAFDMFLSYKALQHTTHSSSFYAITKKNCNIDKLKVKDILSLAEISDGDININKILNFICVNPKYSFDNKKRKLKEIGTTTIEEIINIFPNKKIGLASLREKVPFYERLGFVLDSKDHLNMTRKP